VRSDCHLGDHFGFSFPRKIGSPDLREIVNLSIARLRALRASARPLALRKFLWQGRFVEHFSIAADYPNFPKFAKFLEIWRMSQLRVASLFVWRFVDLPPVVGSAVPFCEQTSIPLRSAC
jgi:hypothetical protein